MHHAQGQQAGQRRHFTRQAAKLDPRRQQQHTRGHLDQRDQVRWRATQALDDQRRDGVQEGRPQRQRNAQQIVLAATLPRAMGTDDGQHAEERHTQPGDLGQGNLLAQEHRRQPHQHERLHVIYRRADGNRRPRIGGEQQHPVADDGNTAGNRQQERRAADHARPQETEPRADCQQGHGTEHAAPEHHLEHRLAGHQHEPADGPGNQHGSNHFQRATTQ